MHPPFDPGVSAVQGYAEQALWTAAVAWENGAEGASRSLNPIEELLGQDAEPDTAFFIDSWTVGAAVASENYLRRRGLQNIREREARAVTPLSAFVSFFVADPVVPAVAAGPHEQAFWPPVPEPRFAAQRPELSHDGEAQEDANEAVARPHTREAACRLLGVTLTSSPEQIKAAYRKMASRYHPDRMESANLGEQQRATERMASINEAHRLLCESQGARSV